MLETLLRSARVTRHLPLCPGLGYVARFYDKTLPLPREQRFRVDDFDGDLKLDVDPREIIGVNVWHRPELWEKEERALFCSAITPGCVVLDVGANIGIYTLLAAKRGAKVFAIEADPANAFRLRQHVELNGFSDRVRIFNLAAGERSGSAALYRDRINSGHSNLFSGESAVSVSCAMIDSLRLPPIDVCKMDIEGAELLALRGMSRTLADSPNMKLLIEYSEMLGASRSLVDMLRERFKSVVSVNGREISRFCNLWATQ